VKSGSLTGTPVAIRGDLTNIQHFVLPMTFLGNKRR